MVDVEPTARATPKLSDSRVSARSYSPRTCASTPAPLSTAARLPSSSCGTSCSVEYHVEQPHAFAEVSVQPPEAPQRARQPEALLELPNRHGPAQGRRKVVVFALESSKPLRLAGAKKFWRCPLGEAEHDPRMTRVRRVVLGGPLQALERIRAQRFEHPKASLIARSAPHKIVLDQCRQVVR